jgi:lipopolysaccharide transport system permease protein
MLPDRPRAAAWLTTPFFDISPAGLIIVSETVPASSLPLRIYSPAPELAHPFRVLKAMWRDLLLSRHIAWRLFLRDFSAQYRVSFLGYAWAFLPPLLNSFIFVILNSQGLLKVGPSGGPYPLFALTGTVLWQLFADSLLMPLTVLQQSKSMLARLNFPRESVILSGLLGLMVTLGIRLLLLAAMMAYYGKAPTVQLLFFPFTLLALCVAGLSLGLLIAPMGILFGDVGRLLSMVLPFWMLLTPVIYPARSHGMTAVIAEWNPVSPLIITARSLLAGSPPEHLLSCLVVTAAASLLLLVGWLGFRLGMPHLVARMG